MRRADEEEIRYTMAVYNTGGDRGKLDELVSGFVEDGVLEIAEWTARGRAEITHRRVKIHLESPLSTLRPAVGRT